MTADLVIAAMSVTLLKRDPESAIHTNAVHTLRVWRDVALRAGIQDSRKMLWYVFEHFFYFQNFKNSLTNPILFDSFTQCQG